jgi:hypothetical protein
MIKTRSLRERVFVALIIASGAKQHLHRTHTCPEGSVEGSAGVSQAGLKDNF